MAAAKARKSKRPAKLRRVATRKPAVRKAPVRGAKAKAGVAGKAVRLAGVSSDAVLKATGRAWEEWLKVLDRAGAKSMAHKDIAVMLSRRFKVPDWWSQMVTVGYEQARGMRKLYQTASGYTASASRTMGAAVGDLYEAWNDPRKRARWLPDAPLEVKRATGNKSMRITWTVGDSSVEVGFYPKGAGKSQVAVAHGKLKSTAEVARQKKFWADALGRLKAVLEPAA